MHDDAFAVAARMESETRNFEIVEWQPRHASRYLPLMAGTSQRNRCTRLPELQDAGNLQEYHKLEQNCQDTIAAPLAGILLLR